MFEFMPLMGYLSKLVTQASEHYEARKKGGVMVSPEALAAFIESKAQGWDPEIRGKKALDPATRAAGARFVAGVVINVSGSGK